MVRLLFAVCALSIAAQAAPVAINNGEAQQALISDNNLAAEVASQSQPSSTPSLKSRTKYWIDEFDNIAPYNAYDDQPSPPSPFGQHSRRDSFDVDIETTAEDSSRSEKESLATIPSQEQSTDDTKSSFYRAHVAGYMDLMSRFGQRMDLDHEYIQGFSHGVSILVFLGLGCIVLYLVVLPAVFATWRKKASSVRSLGHRRGQSKHSL